MEKIITAIYDLLGKVIFTAVFARKYFKFLTTFKRRDES
jgi:hypothetical protein